MEGKTLRKGEVKTRVEQKTLKAYEKTRRHWSTKFYLLSSCVCQLLIKFVMMMTGFPKLLLFFFTLLQWGERHQEICQYLEVWLLNETRGVNRKITNVCVSVRNFRGVLTPLGASKTSSDIVAPLPRPCLIWTSCTFYLCRKVHFGDTCINFVKRCKWHWTTFGRIYPAR